MLEDTDPLAKLVSAELRRLADADSDQAVSVIVEVDAPRRTVEVEQRRHEAESRSAGRQIVPETAADREILETNAAEVRALLNEVIGESPHWLRSARSFVVRATPQQLRRIVASPAVRAVWPNTQVTLSGT